LPVVVAEISVSSRYTRRDLSEIFILVGQDEHAINSVLYHAPH